MGGVGKTALALQLAAELKPAFPDAQIYLDLRGVGPEPLSSTQAMAHVVRSFHPDARLPEGQAELAALYRSALDGKRALLVMDNAAGREQAEPLIPPSPCVLLLTSRFRFSLPGLRLQDLEELPLAEARALLLRIEPRAGESAGELARLCGNLPIALRLAGGALAERPDLSPASYVRKLEDARTRLDLVDASLSLSYELLGADLQKLWRALAVFPETFDAAGAAAVWGLEPETAEEGLGALVKSSLVDGENGRYRLHDLARVFAASRLAAAEEEGAQRRHAGHYVTVLAAAEDLYEQGGDAVLDGLRLHDRERANLHAGQAWAAANAGGDEEAARLCGLYALAGRRCLDLRQPRAERIRWLDSALVSARRLGDRAAEGKLLGNMGNAYADMGDARRALAFHEQDLQIAREIGDRQSEAATLGNLGNAYSDLGDAHRALELYEQNLVIAREIGDRPGEGRALGSLGNAYMVLGEPKRAIEYYEQALQRSRETGNRHEEGMALGNLGLAYTDLGDPRRAIGLYERGLEIAREIGDRRGEGYTLGGLGLGYAALGDARRAIEIQEQRLQIARETADRRAEGHAFGNLGDSYRDLGDKHRAIEHYEQQLRIAGEIGDRASEARIRWNLGLLYWKDGELEQALELMRMSVEHERASGHSDAEKLAAQLEMLRAGLPFRKLLLRLPRPFRRKKAPSA